jgi:ABC-type glycerol-3-phosphate transport system substrate-binding protein
MPLVFLGACRIFESDTVVLWTDRPEFALYAQYFNASQSRYHVEVRYCNSLAQELSSTDHVPDIVVGSWLKNSSIRTLFRSLDDLFKEKLIQSADFYPKLLALGNVEEVQYLLPVSFNLPTLVYSQDNAGLITDKFTLEPAEIKSLGQTYNLAGAGMYARIGFSPAWNDAFLFVMATLYQASFREADLTTWDNGKTEELVWNDAALSEALQYIREWTRDANTSIQAEDDFAFKYFYEPPEKLALSGRILFTYMNSAELFTLVPELRSKLDFRWIAGNNSIPLSEETVYYGICKQGKAKTGAKSFTQWFFQGETQSSLLALTQNMYINETLFGIAGGFSAMRTVTEQVFPRFYRELLGHIPPEDLLEPPNILPQHWIALKEKVILPYLYECIRSTETESVRSLNRRISEWYRINFD